MSKEKHHLFTILMTALAMMTVITAAVSLVLYLVPVYDLAIDYLDLSRKTGMDKAAMVRNFRILIHYNLFWTKETLAFPDFASSPSGLVHFRDVKVIFRNIQIMALSGIPLTYLGYRLSRKKKSYRWITWTAILTISLLAGIAAGVWINAEKTFMFLHKILFTNTYWVFNPKKDPIITILPGEVFLIFALEAAVWILIALIILEVRKMTLERRKDR